MEERNMVPQQQEEQADNAWRSKGRSRIHLVVSSLVIIACIAFAAAAILILINEGIHQGSITLTILSIIVGVVIGLLSLMFNFFQWFNSRPSSLSNRSTASISPSQTSSNEHLPSVLVPSQQLSLPTQMVPLGNIETTPAIDPLISRQPEQMVKRTHEDWGEAPHVSQFYGREKELAELEQWILADRCQLMAVLGIGGIGKTALVAKLAERVKDGFEYIFWRSLQNAPPWWVS
jgi:hypothetical protein